MGEIQTLDLFNKIPVIIITSIIFADERNPAVIIPALVASIAIIWSHWEHHHFKIRKFTKVYFFWALAIAPFGAPIAKTLLTVWDPISLTLVRDGVVALILGFFFVKNIKSASGKTWILLILTNLLTTIAWILFYFSYQRLGVIQTVLIFSIQPLLVYIASFLFLKEPLHKKKIIAFIVVLISISTAQLI